jgi:hypothetical protein
MARGTNGPIIKDSGGVSKIDDNETLFVSPTRSIEDAATPRTSMFPTEIL